MAKTLTEAEYQAKYQAIKAGVAELKLIREAQKALAESNDPKLERFDTVEAFMKHLKSLSE